MILETFVTLLFILHLNDARCITTRHVSGFGNRGGGFISNDRDNDYLYFNNERCAWEIAVPPGATISFHFIQMELEPPTSGECFDYVAIYDGPDQNASLLVKQCASSRSLMRRNYQTTQQFGFVYFFTDSSRRNEGFRLRWSRQAPKPSPEALLTRQRPALAPCTDTRFISGLGIEQTGGYITNDKDAESLYFNGESCGWLVSVPADSTIRFYFTKIDLETEDDISSNNSCKYDWIAIYDGARPNSAPLLTKQCSPRGIGKNFYTTQQHAFIQFHTDDSVQYEGFELRWLRQGPKFFPSLMRSTMQNYSGHCLETRYITDHGDHGGFITNDLGPDGLYMNNEHCSWQVQVDWPFTIWLYFTEIELETSEAGECHDWIAIYDGPSRNSTLLTKQCSTSALGANFHTTTPFAFVYFHTDNSQRFKGFKLHWLPQDNAPKSRTEQESTLAPLFTAPYTNCETLEEIKSDFENLNEGAIESPREPSSGLYGNNLRCSWRIVAPIGGTIRFWFTKIDMEHHESCWHDWVSIYDGESNHSRTLAKQCSTRAIGRFFTTTQRFGFVHFRTDGSGRRSGFKLNWALNANVRRIAATTVIPVSVNSTPISANITGEREAIENMTKILFLPFGYNNGTSTTIFFTSKNETITSTPGQLGDSNKTLEIEAAVFSVTSPGSGMDASLIAGLVIIAVVGSLVILSTVAFFWYCRRERQTAIFYLNNIDVDKSVDTNGNNEQIYEELNTHAPQAVSNIDAIDNDGDSAKQQEKQQEEIASELPVESLNITTSSDTSASDACEDSN